MWLAILPGVFLLALAIASLVLWRGLDTSSFQEVLLGQLSLWLGRPVRIEGVEFGFLPPRLRLLGVEVREAGASGNLLLTARSVDAALKLEALFGNEPAVERFQVIEPTLYLRQDQSGHWNFQSIAGHSVASRREDPADPPGTLPVRDCSLREGTVVVERFGRAPVRLTGLEASLTDLSTSGPFPVELRFRLGDTGRVQARGRLGHFEKKGGPTVAATVKLTDGTAQDLEAVLGFSVLPAAVSELSGFMDLELLEETARLEGVLDMQIAAGREPAPWGDWKLEGSARLFDLRCQVADGSDPLRVGSLEASFQPDRIETVAGGVAVGKEEFRLEAELENFQTPHLSFRLSGGRPGWAALRSHLASPADRPRTNTLSRQPYPMFLQSLQGRGDLSLARLHKGDLEMGPLTSGVVLDRGTIRLRPIQMRLHGGTATSSLTLETARSPWSIDLEAELGEVDLNQLLSAHTNHRDEIYGRLSGSLRVQTTASAEGWVRPSRGQARVEVTEGRLAGISLGRKLALLTQAAGLRIEREDTPIEEMSASAQIAAGWVRTRDLMVRTPDFLLTGTGGFSFEEAIELDAVAALLPEAVLETPERGVLGLLAGALPVDAQRRVLLPFKVRGTFAEPHYQLDAARLAQLKLRGGLPDLFKRPPS